ncbi:MAG: PqqD family protein [candidate division WOR-3 bacterium]|nr:PqqD family protein [candidate division WOR-3 bacterium]
MSLPDRPFPNPLTICENGPDGWTLLVNPDTGAAIAVNRTGALIWSLANGRRTVDGIVAGVRRRFPNASSSVDDDVTALLGTLSRDGFIGRDITNDQRRRTKDQGLRTTSVPSVFTSEVK